MRKKCIKETMSMEQAYLCSGKSRKKYTRRKDRFNFGVKGGRRFARLMQRYADDSMVGRMFLDNMDNGIDDKLRYFVGRKEYDMAIGVAFNWKRSREGWKFWSDICQEFMYYSDEEGK